LSSMKIDRNKTRARLRIKSEFDKLGIESTHNQRRQLRRWILALMWTERETYMPTKGIIQDKSLICTLTTKEIKNIIIAAAEHFDCTVEDIKSPCRKPLYAYARHAIAYILRRKYMEYKKIARVLDRTNHTTPMSSYKKVKLLLMYPVFVTELETKTAKFIAKYVDVAVEEEEI